MPVKVRCPSCEKVLNAPDAARGKAVKCPACKGKVRVPSGKKKKTSAVSSAPDSADLLASLDLSKIEDTSARVCPRCGTDAADDDIECQNCGVDLATGMMTEKTRKKRKRKGPDPALYYQELWGDSWRFLTNNKALSIRTAIYVIVLSLLIGICSFMVEWCARTPPKVFWASLSLLFNLSILGWFWFLGTEVIRGTLERKKKLKRINFDIFLVMALGIKAVMWMIISVAQFAIMMGIILVPAILIAPPVGIVLAAMWPLFFAFIVPVTMTHMTMPVQWKAWINPLMWKITFKNFKPVSFWLLMAIVGYLPSLALLGAMAGIFIVQGVAAMQALQLALEGGEDAAAGTGSIVGMGIALLVLSILHTFATAFAFVFAMRGSGLLAVYFGQDMELITRAKEVKFELKKREYDEAGREIKQDAHNWQKPALGFGATVALYLVANIIVYFATGGEYILVPRPIAQLLNLME